jgi:hypothetical protein
MSCMRDSTRSEEGLDRRDSLFPQFMTAIQKN